MRASIANAQSWQQVQRRTKLAPLAASLPKTCSALLGVTYWVSPTKAMFWPMTKNGSPSVNSKKRGSFAPVRRKPLRGEAVQVPSLVAGFAKLVRYRCNALGAFGEAGPSPVVDALIGLKEPKAGPDGTLSWTVDVVNAGTGDDFALFLKELVMPDGQRRPYSMWLAGAYPRVLDGLCKALSLDMRVCDVAWVGMKLRKLAATMSA